MGRGPGHGVYRCLGHGEYLLRLQALHRQKGGHQLGNAGRVENLVHILLVQHRPGVCIHQHRRLGGQRQLLFPGHRQNSRQQHRKTQQRRRQRMVSLLHVSMAPILNKCLKYYFTPIPWKMEEEILNFTVSFLLLGYCMPQTGAVCCVALRKPCPAAGVGFGLTEAGSRGMMTENDKGDTA